jgi:putative ABC transport system substrate-binding protein
LIPPYRRPTSPRRREFILLLGGAGLLWAAKARRARAQQPSMPVIGFLDPRSLETTTDRLRAFRQGLKDAGYVEGDNVAVEYRWGDGQFDRLPVLAAELVRRPVAVIVAGGSAHSAFAGKAATTTIPIVFAVVKTRSGLALWPALPDPAPT